MRHAQALMVRLACAASALLMAASGPARAAAAEPAELPRLELAGSELAGAGLAAPLHGVQIANLGLRFTLEVGALGALGYWGFQVGRGPVEQWALGLGAPVIAAAAWGTFVSPKASMPLGLPERLLVEAVIFGAAAAALAHAGHPGLAKTFAFSALVSSTLNALWPY